MKKLLVIIILFFSLNAFGQNGVEGDYFILMNGKYMISLNTFENSAIVNHMTFETEYEVTGKLIFTTDKKSRVALLNSEDNNILLYDFLSSKETKLTIPYDMKPKTLLLLGNNLFVGGEMGTEILVQYQINHNQWDKLEVPNEVQVFGKAVDDLVVNDSFLIAIDNLVFPKYILFYDLKFEGKLELSHFRELKANGSYESIHQGIITSEYLGIVSETIGYGIKNEHITIYSDPDLINSFALSARFEEVRAFNDFLLIENKLIIAHRKKGLGIFEIKDSYFTANSTNSRVDENLIVYKPYEKGEIIRMTIIPNTSKIILTIRDPKGEISNEIVDI